MLHGSSAAVLITRENYTKGVTIHQTYSPFLRITSLVTQSFPISCLVYLLTMLSLDAASRPRLSETAAVAEWLRAWNTLTMFEATVCGRS